MADDKDQNPEKENDHEDDVNYKPPPEKSLKEIVQIDQDDESLQKYKEALLGQATKEEVIVDPNNPNRVIVKSLSLLADGRPDLTLDLTGDIQALKKNTFAIKEGIQYRVRIEFWVQREIVTGLKYIQRVFRHAIQHEKMTHMVGSYAPKLEPYSYTTPPDEMPSGMLTRGTYTVKSLFTDDDKFEHLKWEWNFELKKDWN